jgi:hypothetical protein
VLAFKLLVLYTIYMILKYLNLFHFITRLSIKYLHLVSFWFFFFLISLQTGLWTYSLTEYYKFSLAKNKNTIAFTYFIKNQSKIVFIISDCNNWLLSNNTPLCRIVVLPSNSAISTKILD